MNNFIINNNKGRIEFLDNRFYLTEDGGYVPSVTTILEAFPKDAAYFKWIKEVGSDADAIRDEAGRRGSVVHQLTEEYDAGHEVSFIGQDAPKYKMLEWAMFERYVDFTETHKPEIVMMEQNFASPELGYAGTIDRVIELNGKRILMDIKTSNNLHQSYWLQLAAYDKLLMFPHLAGTDEVGILWLNAKTRTTGKNGAIQGIGWQLITKSVFEIQDDWQAFLHTKSLWEALNKDIKPKQTSYQLKHKR
jgi:hypothetical protein